MNSRFLLISLLFGVLVGPLAHAQVLFEDAEAVMAGNATVLVACDTKQGSGTVVNGTEGYVLTAGHVVITDLTSGNISQGCTVAFPDDQGRPRYEYRASIVRAVYNEKLNQDFAIVKIGSAIGFDHFSRPFPTLVTNEFTTKGDAVRVWGYPGPQHMLVSTSGVITDYVGGFIDVTAEISPGDSGGSAVDAQGRLIGMASRILTYTSSGGQSHVTFELVDIRAVMNWLDTFGVNEHDKFFTHADSQRFHRAAVFINQDNLGCEALARSPAVSSVYCVVADGTRYAFPTDTTFFSWFSDFKDVLFVSGASLAEYRLTRNVTFKPGTLVKVKTAPAVYVVIDSFGALRQVPSEQKAIELWGPTWSGLVRDVPDEFWVNYTIGQPLEP